MSEDPVGLGVKLGSAVQTEGVFLLLPFSGLIRFWLNHLDVCGSPFISGSPRPSPGFPGSQRFFLWLHRVWRVGSINILRISQLASSHSRPKKAAAAFAFQRAELRKREMESTF